MPAMNTRIIRLVSAVVAFGGWVLCETSQWIAERTIPGQYDDSAGAFFAATLTLTFFIACLYLAIGPQKGGDRR